MKEISLIFLVCALFVGFLAGCGEPVAETVPKTAEEKLCDFVFENGANYQGTYKVIELLDSGSFTISCDPQKVLSFSYHYESDDADSYFEMEYYEGSVTQRVSLQYIQSGYVFNASGTIYTEMVNMDTCEVYSVKYTHNFPSMVSSTVEKLAGDPFDSGIKAMLAQFQLVLLKYTDISLNDLGFSAW